MKVAIRTITYYLWLECWNLHSWVWCRHRIRLPGNSPPSPYWYALSAVFYQGCKSAGLLVHIWYYSRPKNKNIISTWITLNNTHHSNLAKEAHYVWEAIIHQPMAIGHCRIVMCFQYSGKLYQGKRSMVVNHKTLRHIPT